MRKLLIFILLFAFFHACSSIFNIEQQTPQVVEISDDYQPKSSSDKIRYQLQLEAEKLIGSKYKYGGTTPRGFDCSGFTGYIYDKVAIDISRSSQTQASKGKEIKVKDVQKGDLLFFTGKGRHRISHVAMVLSNDARGIEVIHSTTSSGVRKDNITHSAYWKPKLLFARRIVE